MSAIRCDVDPVGTRLLVRVRGELSLASAPRVRAVLLKSLVDQPDAIVVDLTGAVIAEPAAAAVFAAVSRHASLWPGTPLLLAAPDPELARVLATTYSRLAVHSSVAAALAAEPRRRMPSVSDRLLPVSGAAQRARDLATEACLRWELPHLTGPASLIANELVANAVVHAQTMVDLRMTLGPRYLTVAVRDGSAAEPVLPCRVSADPAVPRGLMLVDAMAVRWGSLPAHDGKIVWATLPRRTGAG
ncbi:STAS domain-containing protein [Actinoplanes teichomyceticus]|uniref:STAS domain-containing protein n=1 Tax=Actinoplanes teichomyceticus TaxID=1867 RepID=UPI00165687CF|nr:STAS domain-containing protein [Actinoplanes teichomyceticus]GIF14992.1 hypothetical protein Ate01nite_50240 [Actinoplanes teichomyceticus]